MADTAIGTSPTGGTIFQRPDGSTYETVMDQAPGVEGDMAVGFEVLPEDESALPMATRARLARLKAMEKGEIETPTKKEPELVPGTPMRIPREEARAPGAVAPAPSAIDIELYRLGRLEKDLKGLAKKRTAAEAELINLQKEQASDIFQAQGLASDTYQSKLDEYTSLQEDRRVATESAKRDMALAEQAMVEYKVDPNRAFSSVAQRVGSAIAIAVGAFAQGLSGGRIPNTAYQIIRDAIGRDIDAQKVELQKRKDVLRNKNNVFAQMMQEFKNEEEALLMTQKMGLTKAKMDLANLATKHKSQGAQQAIDALAAKLDEEAAEVGMKLAGFRTRLAIAKDAAGRRAGVVGGARDKTTRSLGIALDALRRAKDAFTGVGPIEGAWGSFLKVLGGDSAVAAASTNDVTRYETLRTQLAHFYTNATNGARPTDKDFAIVLGLIPAAITNKGNAEQMFDTLEQTLMRAQDEGALVPGMIEQMATAAGYDVNKLANPARIAEAKSYLDAHFTPSE